MYPLPQNKKELPILNIASYLSRAHHRRRRYRASYVRSHCDDISRLEFINAYIYSFYICLYILVARIMKFCDLREAYKSLNNYKSK